MQIEHEREIRGLINALSIHSDTWSMIFSTVLKALMEKMDRDKTDQLFQHFNQPTVHGNLKKEPKAKMDEKELTDLIRKILAEEVRKWT